MKIQEKKKNIEYLTGGYAKQERSMMLAELCRVTGKSDNGLFLVEKKFNDIMHIFTGPRRPTFKEIYYFQAILSIAGKRLYEYGEQAKAENYTNDLVVQNLVEGMTDKDIEIKNEYGLGSQLVIYTSYYEILKTAGFNVGTNSKNALTEALKWLGRIVHEVHHIDDYNNGKEDRGYNELFLKYKYDTKEGKVKIVLNSFSTDALTGQYSLIDLNIKSYLIKNERALALYDFIVSRVNHKESQLFSMERAIKILEGGGEVDKYVRNKYKKALLCLSDLLPDWYIDIFGRGEKLNFHISRGIKPSE